MASTDQARQSLGSGKPSPFFYTPPTTELDSLAILHLKRDSLLPVTLKATADDGYAEGAVTNTRFGSFPHSTLVGLEWGSQVRASKVDTGTRGRKGKKAKQEQVAESSEVQAGGGAAEMGHRKRKSDEMAEDGVDVAASLDSVVDGAGASMNGRKKLKSDNLGGTASNEAARKVDTLIGGARTTATTPRVPIEAGSGFVHVLPPTPEAWTYSLDHRTQVVYTPDYSYILQRLRVRPGDRIIEAGAGSGSFTHAAARAIYSGGPSANDPTKAGSLPEGKVYSFEYHAPRVETLRQELSAHGLDEIVHLTHRDVCNDGFTLDPPSPESSPSLPKADAIFLDLPAPWHALKHLTRHQPHSPLNPATAVHLCTFSPCIEQVQATVSHLRRAGWTEIQMVEVQNKRVDVRREQVGLKNEGLRGVNAAAATVAEAVGRLREVETKLSDFHAAKGGKEGTEIADGQPASTRRKVLTKQERLEKIKREAEERKLYKEGNVVHRTEPEVKTHTSYLVFAVLPREWSEEDERACGEKWSVEEGMKSPRTDVRDWKGEKKGVKA